MSTTRLHRTYDWIGRHVAVITAVALMAVLALGVAGPLVANTDEPDFNPSGGVFETYEYVDETLRSTSTVAMAMWLVESNERGENVLTQAALLEWKQRSDAVRGNPTNAAYLVDRYDTESGTSIPGVLSIADLVDGYLPGGLAAASDTDVQQALSAMFAEGAPFADMRATLSEQAELTPAGWVSPAFSTQVVYDASGFEDAAAEETWLRDVQAEFREGAVATDSIGVTIDPELVFSEAAQQSSPFIFLAVALIILLVAFVHRSYWSSVVVGAGLAATALAYYGTAALLGLKMGSMLLAFVVPIAMISFGVDFYIHGVGRVREAQVDDGHDARRAYPLGMTAVFTAMFLAVTSSVSAFLANAASGTEAIIQFGIGAGVSLVWAYLLLGQLAPRVTVGLEDFVGDDPVKGLSRFAYALGALCMAVIGGIAVALAAVMPAMGVAALVVYLMLFVGIPALITRRRNRIAAERGRTLVHGHNGAAHGLESAGSVVHFLAKWRFVTIPVVVVIGALALVQAMRVDSGFRIEDMLSTETDFAQSIERVRTHFPSSGEGTSYIYLEGDLTDPANLAAIDGAVAELDASSADFGRDSEGDIIVGIHAGDVVRMVMASPARTEIEATGPSLIDADGNGIPDSKAAIAAIYRHAWANGVLTPDGEMAIAAADLGGVLGDLGDAQATAIVISVGSYTDGDIIVPVQQQMDATAASYLAGTSNVDARVSGDVITSYRGLESFTRSMIVSLPLALLFALVIASLMLRSPRYAFVSVLPIGLVVVGVYAFMATFGYTVNVVTATIAAIAVGVGIDFSTHFTARYREEVNGRGHRLEAVRRAGAGTGGALVLSALTSVMGFLVMALAPTPIFATFGVLTAVMIVLSLLVAVLVLPSLLVLVTPSKGRERERRSDEVREPATV
ncbi:MAG: MMPL family transporter [Acidimicrobiia bacterium]|nr:MMPL family transporter [Acidimicrobiia bacterium]